MALDENGKRRNIVASNEVTIHLKDYGRNGGAIRVHNIAILFTML